MAAGRQAWREGEREGSGDLVTTGQANGILEWTLATRLWEGCWLDPPGASGSDLHQTPERMSTWRHEAGSPRRDSPLFFFPGAGTLSSFWALKTKLDSRWKAQRDQPRPMLEAATPHTRLGVGGTEAYRSPRRADRIGPIPLDPKLGS